MTTKFYELSSSLQASFAPRLGVPRPVRDDSGELAGYVAEHVEPRGRWYEMYDTEYNSYGEAAGLSFKAAENELRTLVGKSARPQRLHLSARLIG